jgi:hypothetical protein
VPSKGKKILGSRKLRDVLDPYLQTDELQSEDVFGLGDTGEIEVPTQFIARDVDTVQEVEALGMRMEQTAPNADFDFDQHEREALAQALDAIEREDPPENRPPDDPSPSSRERQLAAPLGWSGYQACYLPFRYRTPNLGRWGIEISLFHVVRMGIDLKRLGATPLLALNVARQYLWHHEIYHFRTERVVEMLESVQLISGSRDVYALGSRLKTRHFLEEALAVARSLNSVKSEFRKLPAPALTSIINYFVTASTLLPPGYRDFGLVRSSNAFYEGSTALVRLYLAGAGVSLRGLKFVPREVAFTLRARDTSYPELNRRSGREVPIFYS